MHEEIAAALPDYDIGRELGRGQFGAVFLVRHRRLGRDAAVKQLVGQPSAADAARFHREARILAQLDHAHVVTVYDYREQGSVRALVMELLTGGTFADRIHAGISTETAVAGTLAAASGLHHVHQQGVLHRDVKPENLMLSGAGVLKVTDFGLARGEIAGQTVAELTQAGSFFGTPAYAAPEQVAEALATGWPAIGPAADQYALATVLYSSLSGELPHDTSGGLLALCERRMNVEARPLHEVAPDVAPELEVVVMRALARHPEARHESVEAFALALATAATTALGPDWIERAEIQIREPGPIRDAAHAAATTEPATPPPRSGWRWPMVAAPIAVALVVALLFVLSRPAAAPSGAAGPGGSPANAAPLAVTLTPTWQYKAGGKIFASPLVTAGLVVVGSFDHKLYGLDSATGALRWTFDTGDGVRSSAAFDDGVAFVGSDDGNVYAVGTSDGHQRWKASLGYQVVSSPAVSNGTVVVGADALYALGESDGATKWRFDTGASVVSSPAVADGVAFVGATNGKVFAVDLASGTQKWVYDAKGPVVSSPVVRDGVVYVGTDAKAVVALDAATGTERWRMDAGAEVRSTPAVSDRSVIVGTGGNRLMAFDRASGAVRWSFDARDKIDSSPLLLDRNVVAGSNDGNVYVVDQNSGTLEGQYRANDQIASSPRRAGARVIVAAYDGTIYALDGLPT